MDPLNVQATDENSAPLPLLEVTNLVKHFPLPWSSLFGKRQSVKAVDGISFKVAKGETLGIVGESGCGKSTTSRLLVRLLEPDSGSILINGQSGSERTSTRQLRRKMQMVFQHSYASLNPRISIELNITFGLHAKGVTPAKAKEISHNMLNEVGLAPERFAQRYPHELSGGQRQRVNIARSLALTPEIVILDEPVSALDKSTQAQIINLLNELKYEHDLTYLFISHDLDVIRYVSDNVVVMYLGMIMEQGPVEAVYQRPQHPYTSALLAARLSLDPDERTEKTPLQGEPASAIDPPSGCRFRNRCPFAEPVCARDELPLDPGPQEPGTLVACHMRKPGSGHSKAEQV